MTQQGRPGSNSNNDLKNNPKNPENEPHSSYQSGSNGSNRSQNDAEAKKQKRRDEVLRLYTQPGPDGKTLTAREISKRTGIARNTIAADLRFLKENGNCDISTDKSVIAGRKWSKALNTIANEILPYYISRDNPQPSLRTIFYDLEERKLIGGDRCPNDYNLLSRYTGWSRIGDTHLLPGYSEGLKDPSLGISYPKLPINCLADETREVIDNFNDDDPVESTTPIDPDEYIQGEIMRLANAPRNYTGVGNADSPGGFWYKQPEYVEVMIEKFALKPSFKSFLKDRYVTISINKGYSSISFLHRNCERLKEKIEKYGVEHVHVLYFGDKDPSGDNMFKVLQRYLNRLGVPSTILKKIALTDKQIKDYHISTTTITGLPRHGKKRGDSRAKRWIQENGNQGAHLDAFVANKRDTELEKIVQDCVDQYHDKKIFEEMKKKYDGSHTLEIKEDLDSARRRMCRKITKAFEPGWYAPHRLPGFDNYAFAENVICLDVLLGMKMLDAMRQLDNGQ